MNILHHKSWHVRTKANMQRVRRDEAKAAEEEKRILERQIQAENERRITVLRNRAEERTSKMFGVASGSGQDVSISDSSGHVNLFQDLEREERKLLGSGNKEYEEEKKKEKREWESKMGIQVYFADGTNDLEKKKEWYETIPVRRKIVETEKVDFLTNRRKLEEIDKEKRKRKVSDSLEDGKKKKNKKEKKKKKKNKKHRKRESSDDEEECEISKRYEEEKKRRLQELRDERLRRERREAARTYSLLNPEKEEKEKKPKYNSQFNPEFSRN